LAPIHQNSRWVLYNILSATRISQMCQSAVSRRDFSTGWLEVRFSPGLAWRRAAWAQAMAHGAATDLFEIQNVTEGVYFAFAAAGAGEL
jgi:hypothetical protein